MFEFKRINRLSHGVAFVLCVALVASVVVVSTSTTVQGVGVAPFTSVSIQGRLKDGSGSPLLSPSANIVVNLYDAETGGTLLYSDEHTVDLSTTNGFYVLPFGEGTNPGGSAASLDEALRNNTYVWFTLNVNSDGEMSPRTRLQGSAFAHNSFTLDGSRYVKETDSGSGSPSGFATPQAGDLWYDETNNTLNYFDGSSWVGTGGGGGGSFLPLAGGTMAGDIDMSGFDVFNANLVAATMFTGDGAGITNLDPTQLSAAVGETLGGTGQTTYAAGDMLYASAANVLAALPAGGAGEVLTMVGGVPSWQTAAGGGDFQSSGVVPMSGNLDLGSNSIVNGNDIAATTFTGSGAALTGLDGSNVATGVVGAMFGGTGQAIYAAGDVLYATGPTTLAKLPIAADGDVLTLSGGLPIWQAPGGGGFPLLAPDGAVGAPTYSFSSDATTGIFAPTPGEVGVTIAGVEKLVARPTGVEFLSFTAGSSVRFLGDPNSTLFQLPDDGVSLTAPAAADEGSLRWNLAGDVVEVWNGAAWVPVGGAGGGDFLADGSVAMTGALNMNGAGGPHNITGVNDVAAATFTGNGSGLTSLSGSNIASGAVGAAFGGTGQAGYAAGDILYATGPSALAKLPIATDGDVLTLSGGLPTWQPGGGGGGDFLADGSVPMTAALQAVDGSMGSPSYTFASDTASGMFKQAASEIGFTIGGTDTFTIRGGGTPQVFGLDGNTVNPAYSFKFGTDTGMWFGNPGLNFSAGATHIFKMTNAGTFNAMTAGGVGAPIYTFDTSPDTGLWLAGPGELGIAAQGVDMMRVKFDRIGVNTTTPVETFHVDRNNSAGGITTAILGEDTFGDGVGVAGEAIVGATVNTGGKFRADGGSTDNYGVIGLAGGVVSPTATALKHVGVYGEIDEGVGGGGYAGFFLSTSQSAYSAGVYGESVGVAGTDHAGGQFYASGASANNIGVDGRADDFVGEATDHFGGLFTAEGVSNNNFGVVGIAGSFIYPSVGGGPLDIGVYGETDADDGFAGYFRNTATAGATLWGLYVESEGAGGADRIGGEFYATGGTGSNIGLKVTSDDFAGSGVNHYAGFLRVTGGSTLNVGLDVVADASGAAATTHTGGQFRATGGTTENYGVVGLAGGLFNPGLSSDTASYGETDLAVGYGMIASNSFAGPISGAGLWVDVSDTTASNVVAQFTTGGGANPIVTMQADGYVGIGNAAPNAYLDVAGVVATPVNVQTGNYSIVPSDSVILANAGGITITLPSAASSIGHRYSVKNISAGSVTVDTSAGNIDGSASVSLGSQFDGIEVVSDGVDWFIVAETGGGGA